MKDGGSAFPSEQGETSEGLWNQTYDPGMSLRDYALVHLTAAWVTALGGPHNADDYVVRESIRLGEIQSDIVIAIQADTIIAKREEAETNVKK